MKLDGQQQPPQMNFDIEKDTKVISCKNKLVDLEKGIERVCGGQLFAQGYELRRVSPLISPNGQEAIIPVAVFACEKCNHVNEEFEKMDIE